MPLVGVPSRERQFVLTVKFEFLGNDFKRLAGFFANNGPIQHVIGDVFDVVGQTTGRNRSFRFDCGFIIAPLPPAGQHLVTRHGEVILALGFVVAEKRHFRREKLTPLTRRRPRCGGGGLHMSFDFGKQSVVLGLGVLFVQNAKLFVLQTHAAQKILAVARAPIRVVEVAGAKARVKYGHRMTDAPTPYERAIVAFFHAISPHMDVHAVLRVHQAVRHVAAVALIIAVKTHISVLGIIDVVAHHVFVLDAPNGFNGLGFKESFGFVAHLIHHPTIA